MIGNAIKVARIATGEEEEEYVAKPEAAPLSWDGFVVLCFSIVSPARLGSVFLARPVDGKVRDWITPAMEPYLTIGILMGGVVGLFLLGVGAASIRS